MWNPELSVLPLIRFYWPSIVTLPHVLRLYLLVLLDRTEASQGDSHSPGSFQEWLTADFPCREIKYSWKMSEWFFFLRPDVHTSDVCFAQPQSCPTLWDPMDCSLPGSSVHGIFQARILEWVARCLFCHIINICLWQIIRTKQWKIIMNLLLLKL